jgi:maltooligosyltrehalose trehalohydrolase
VVLHIAHPERPVVTMERRPGGYFETVVEQAPAGTLYTYRLDGGPDRPDPASRFQPSGVHGPSEVIDPAFEWQDETWRGLPLETCVFYELHVGTFTAAGTFDAIIPRLDELRELGVNFLELMPVAQFPGSRNWGYDGVCLFAVQNSYGGPEGLRRLVNECHRRGMGVALDIVYNHLGPEGNYLAEFGPYFTDSYRTPWGLALNFDGPESDEVRQYFIENALYWIRDFHIDALRLDAVHGIFDRSAYPFLEELGDAVHQEAARLNRPVHVIPESDLNDPRLIRPKELGGFGLDAQWADDFHHALHVLLTGERSGYYEDFDGLGSLARVMREGFVYTGQYSQFRRRRHGASPGDLPGQRFVVFSQNHDQVGNRMLGERLSSLASFEALKLAAAAVLLSPYVPLLFMGEEYGEVAPFLYFVSHSDAGLVDAVRRGRTQEFAGFAWRGEPPDPQVEETFLRSKLHWELRNDGEHRTLRLYYRELLRLRREVGPLRTLNRRTLEVVGVDESQVLLVRRWRDEDEVLVVLCFAESDGRVRLPAAAGLWRKLLDSAEAAWRGPGSTLPEQLESPGAVDLLLRSRSAAVYGRSQES